MTNNVGCKNGAGVGDGDGNNVAFEVTVVEFVVVLTVDVEANGVGVGVGVMVITTGDGRVASRRCASPMCARTLFAGSDLTGSNGATTTGAMVFVRTGGNAFAFVFGAMSDALFGVGDAFGAATFAVEVLTELFFDDDADCDVATGAVVFTSTGDFGAGEVFSDTLRGRVASPEGVGVREPARV